MNSYNNEKVGQQLERDSNGALMDVVKYLHKEVPIEESISEICEIVCTYMNVHTVGVARRGHGNRTYISVAGYEQDQDKKWSDFLMNMSGYDVDMRDTEVIPGDDENRLKKLKKIINLSGFDSLIVSGVKLLKKTDMFLMILSDDGRKWTGRDVDFAGSVADIIRSIFDKAISKNSIAGAYGTLKEILDNIGAGIYVTDKNSREVLFSNKNMVRLLGMDPVGRKCSDFHFAGPEEENCENCQVLARRSHYREIYKAEKNTWYAIKNHNIVWVDGRQVSLCCITDISDRKKYENRVEFQTNNDFLTGLYNRMRCEKDINESVLNAVKSDKKGMVMFINLDNFRHLNEGMGHQFGDMLLKMVSIGLQQISGIEDKCYRMGGDEFVVLIEPEKEERADEIIAAVQRLFRSPWYLNGAEYYCTMSMGVVCYPNDGKDVKELLKKADIAMHAAKRGGKDRVEYYSFQNKNELHTKMDIEKNMRKALSLGCDEFKVYIQPIYDIKKEKYVGGEVLVRWDSGNLGFLSPDDFIPLAENLGLIHIIDDYILEIACKLNKSWSDLGVDVYIHVNLSIVQLMGNTIIENVQGIIESTGVKPQNLVLEVTESVAVNDMNRMIKTFAELKNLGVNIALDDFGTGYSSLNYITQMNFDIIKIDKSLIDHIVEDDYSQTLVKLIAELSEQSDVKVCIEGVETEEQLDTFKKMNVSMIQGYYYGKPIPYEQFEKEFLRLS